MSELEAASPGLAEKIAELLRDTSDQAQQVEKLRGKVPEKAIKDGKLDWNNLDTGIEYSGAKITLPSDPAKMPIKDAIRALKRKEEDENTEVSVHEIIDAFPTDGAVAFVRAIREIYGWANSVPTPGFFGSNPPRFITVDTGPEPGDKIQVPWGGFQIPGIEKPVNTGTTESINGPVFVMYGSVRKKEVWVLRALADRAREIVAKESIYQGKAIRIRDNNGNLDLENPPQFISTKHIRPEELILPREVEGLVQTNVWNLIEHTQKAIDQRIPLKRGILLEATYGTGKSMTALVTAKKAVDNGWTYITIDRAQGLKMALEFAKRYEPAVIFAEDIDRTQGERTEKANDLLNILDGVLSKSSRIMVVLTTNHVEKINRAMLRPGRLDAVISITPPDAEAVERLIRLYGRNLITPHEDLGEIGKRLAGQVPATIREVVERAKLATIAKDDGFVTQDDLIIAATGMTNHLALLNKPSGRRMSSEERVGRSLVDAIEERISQTLARATAISITANEVSSEGGDGRIVSRQDQASVFELTSEIRQRILQGTDVVTEFTANGTDNKA